jgi:hypothetical protein
MSPSHNNEKSENVLRVGVARWHPEEIPWPSRRRSKLAVPTIMTIPKKIVVELALWHPEAIP